MSSRSIGTLSTHKNEMEEEVVYLRQPKCVCNLQIKIKIKERERERERETERLA
jgi:hypothetical protein